MDKELELPLEASQEAGAAIMHDYQQTLTVQHKQDDSSLTPADKAAHRVIDNCLVNSGLGIVSEEGESLHLATEQYWMVDPLDGTKDFMAGNGEFTVNIALVDQNCPELGVVFAPAISALYWGAKGMGAWCIREGAVAALPAPPRSSSLRDGTQSVSRSPGCRTVCLLEGHYRARSDWFGAEIRLASLRRGGCIPAFVGSS